MNSARAVSWLRVKTVPVGLFGLVRSTIFVLGVAFSRKASKSKAKFSDSRRGTETALAPNSWGLRKLLG